MMFTDLIQISKKYIEIRCKVHVLATTRHNAVVQIAGQVWRRGATLLFDERSAI